MPFLLKIISLLGIINGCQYIFYINTYYYYTLIAYLLTAYTLSTIQKQNSTEKDLCFFSDADVLASLVYRPRREIKTQIF